MSKKPDRLGRGLEALLPTDIDDEFVNPALRQEVAKASDTLIDVDINQIAANPSQPRSDFDDQSLQELASSIRVHGIIQPLIVEQISGHEYSLVAGERRLRAAKLAKLKVVPAIVRTHSQQQRLEVALIENIQREDLNLLDEAAAYNKLMYEFGMRSEDLAERVGKSRPLISNTMRMLKLSPEAKQAIIDGKIKMGHAIQILSLPDLESQQTLLEAILSRHLTIQQAEHLARQYLKGNVSTAQHVKEVLEGTPEENTVIGKLGKLLKTKVQIQHHARGGRLVIEYKDSEELQGITKYFYN